MKDLQKLTNLKHKVLLILLWIVLGLGWVRASVQDSSKKEVSLKTPVSHYEKLQVFYNKFGINLDETELPLSLFDFIKRWYHTPYRYGGKSKWGTDCSGFTGLLCDSIFGFDLPRTAYDQYDPRFHIHKSDLKEGDLVFFKIGYNYRISHVGLYLGNHKFVHAAIYGGVIISDLREPYYARWYVGASRNIEYLRETRKQLKIATQNLKQVFFETLFHTWLNQFSVQ